MADNTRLTFVGDWRITVTGRDASWAQRVSVHGTAAGDQTLGGNPGAVLDVYGNGQVPWVLTIEHNDGQHGWQPDWVRGVTSISGASYTWNVQSEDNTTPSSDRDFNDLVIELDKLGMAAQPVPPCAILPGPLQAMPEGVFEASLGNYFMAVRVQNIWTLAWLPSARVGLTDRCRAWLAAAGVVSSMPGQPRTRRHWAKRLAAAELLWVRWRLGIRDASISRWTFPRRQFVSIRLSCKWRPTKRLRMSA